MNQKAIRIRNNSNVDNLAKEIVELVNSGYAISLEVIGKTSNFLAILAIKKALMFLNNMGREVETIPEFEQFPVWENNPEGEKKTGIKWTIKTTSNTVQ